MPKFIGAKPSAPKCLGVKRSMPKRLGAITRRRQNVDTGASRHQNGGAKKSAPNSLVLKHQRSKCLKTNTYRRQNVVFKKARCRIGGTQTFGTKRFGAKTYQAQKVSVPKLHHQNISALKTAEPKRQPKKENIQRKHLVAKTSATKRLGNIKNLRKNGGTKTSAPKRCCPFLWNRWFKFQRRYLLAKSTEDKSSDGYG